MTASPAAPLPLPEGGALGAASLTGIEIYTIALKAAEDTIGEWIEAGDKRKTRDLMRLAAERAIRSVLTTPPSRPSAGGEP